jgi:hypothetical protein
VQVFDCAINASLCSAPTDSAEQGFYFGATSSTGGGSSTGSVTVVVQVPDILNLSPEQGGEISGAILLVWAVGWAFRVAIQALRKTDGEPSSTKESES